MDTLRQLTDGSGPTDTFVRAPEMRALLEQAGPLTDWPEFAASWDDLGPDTYMADGGRYRKRRHAVFAVSGERDRSSTGSAALPEPRLQHAEWRDRTMVRAGDRAVGAGATMTTILTFCRNLFGMVSPARAWHVEVHQFRIEARRGEEAVRRRRVCIATGWTTCWCCW